MADIVESIDSYALSKRNQDKSLFSKVGVVGAGTVGQTIIRMIAISGIEVIFIELDDDKIDAAIKAMSSTI